MKKKCIVWCGFYGHMRRYLFIMKLTVLLCFAGVMGLSASTGYSQEKKLTLDLNQASILEIFQEIEAQSEFVFIYKNEAINLDNRVNVKMTDSRVDKILDKILKGMGVRYQILDRQIVITPEKEPVSKPSPKLVVNDSEQDQKREIRGTVKDDKGAGIPGASVMVKGTVIGVVTDIDGNYTFAIPASSKTLVFSFVGMKSQEIELTSESVINVTLKEENVGIDEVVVVGYGVQKKETVVGAITQVDNQSLMRSGTSNVTNAIAGKLSGVLTMQQTGQPGSEESEIIIRGLSSWNGSQPLVLVDGVERDFKDLDPNEINSISVLKDASATAVFGAKGANGVIIVTTKRGKQGKPELDFSASYGIQKATRVPDHIDSYTTMSAYNYALKNQGLFSELIPDDVLAEYKNPSSRINSLRYPNVNWFDELTYNSAPIINANFNVTGGTDFVKYFCSLGYLHESSLFKSYKDGYLDQSYRFDKLNYRANLDFALTSSTQLSFNVGGDYNIQNQPKDSPWRNLYQTSPARFPAYFPAWVLDEIPDPDYPDDHGIRLSTQLSEYTGNPYNQLFQGNFNEYTESKLFTDLIVNQKLDFVTKGLSVKGKVALSTYYKIRSLYSDYSLPKYRIDYDKIGTDQNPWVREGETDFVYILPPVDLNVGALEGGYYSDLYYELSTEYSRVFGNHSITGLALFNRQQKNQETEFAYYNESWVGRVIYNYSQKYLLEFNLGYTGSERFAPGKRFGFFPSAALGWVLSEEKFFKSAFPWISKMKLRYSDGLVGSDAAPERWLYQSSYFKDNAGKIREDKIANSVAQWENAHKRDLGIEFSIFDNKLSFNIDLFDEYRKNMLLEPRTVTFLVGNTFKSLNRGEMKKHGIEVEVEYNSPVNSNFSYHLRGVFGYNDNRIIFKDDLPYAPEYKKLEGKPLGAQLGGVMVTGSGYYTSIDDIHNNPSAVPIGSLNVGDYKFLDYSADGKIDNMDQFPVKGNLYPPVTFSLSGGFVFKKFEFNILLQGNTGKWVDFNQIYETEFTKGSLRIHESQLDYWTPENQGANHATLHYFGTGDNPQLMWGGGEADRGYGLKLPGRYWRNADYLRIKEIYAGYTLKSKYLNTLAGVSNLVLYASANNVLTLTKLIEGDPERKDFQQGFYPQLMTLKLGLKVAF